MTDGKRHAQKACFAIIKNLKPALEAEGLTEDAVWAYVKETHNVESRSDLTERQYVVLQARLSAAARDSHLFLSFCSEIQNIVPSTAIEVVQRDDAKFVDVTLRHSADMYSSCLVNLDTKKVQGRKMDVFRITETITGENAATMTRQMQDKAILKHVTKQVAPAPELTPERVESVLRAAVRWLTADKIAEALNTENGEAVLAALRVLYQQKVVVYRQVGASEWFKHAEGGKS